MFVFAIDMCFDSSSVEFHRTFVADDATGVGCKLQHRFVDHSLSPSGDFVIDDIDLIDDVAVELAVDDGSMECRTLHHQMMACEMSVN